MGHADRRKEENLQRIREFRLFDDDFMTKCFEDNPECTELVLHIILGIEDLKVIDSQVQYSIKNLQGRSVRLDIYAVDGENKHYNIEIQRAEKGAGVKRARYNSSLLDANSLEAGSDVDYLTENYVIFITETDVLGGDKPIYHVNRVIEETCEIFGDGSHIIYVNGAYTDESPLGLLMRDFACTKPEDMHYEILANRARYFKENVEGVRAMCKAMEEFAEEVKNEEKISIAINLLALKTLTVEQIAESVKLPVEVIESLRTATNEE